RLPRGPGEVTVDVTLDKSAIGPPVRAHLAMQLSRRSLGVSLLADFGEMGELTATAKVRTPAQLADPDAWRAHLSPSAFESLDFDFAVTDGDRLLALFGDLGAQARAAGIELGAVSL